MFSKQDDALLGWPDAISADLLMDLETYQASFSVEFDPPPPPPMTINRNASVLPLAFFSWKIVSGPWSSVPNPSPHPNCFLGLFAYAPFLILTARGTCNKLSVPPSGR